MLKGAEVSIHTRHHWRVKRALLRSLGARLGVSIHTRHHWRVKPAHGISPKAKGQFQSTPAITGG